MTSFYFCYFFKYTVYICISHEQYSACNCKSHNVLSFPEIFLKKIFSLCSTEINDTSRILWNGLRASILLLKRSRMINVRKQRRPLWATCQLLQRVSRDDVTADETDRRIGVRALLAKYWTREHGVKPTFWPKININLCSHISACKYLIIHGRTVHKNIH